MTRSAIRILGAAALLLSVGACGPTGVTTRAAPLDAPNAPAAEFRQAVTMQAFTFTVPEGLVVSESHFYYPTADIVWHGDPFGDRPAQIAALFREAADMAMPMTEGGRGVEVHARLVRFHGLSPRARMTVGGVHNVIFDISLRDAATGAVLDTRRVDASIRAFGGISGYRAESMGQTQRVRVREAIARALVEEMAAGVPVPAPLDAAAAR